MEYLVWVDGTTFANAMYDKEEPDEYTIGKFKLMQDKLSTYLCNLDYYNQMKLMQLAMEYHEDPNKVIMRSRWYIKKSLDNSKKESK